jgi:hypothetical protein
MPDYVWHNCNDRRQARQFVCGHCDRLVASKTGYLSNNDSAHVLLCPNCNLPTIFDCGDRFPGVKFGGHVEHISDANVAAVFDEARRCMSVSAYTAAAITCRKLLMNVAVAHGAEPGQSFVSYIDHLVKVNVVPPTCKDWVDHIRKRGNEATHEIHVVPCDDAEQLIAFSEMLLKLIYEFPGKLKPAKA